MKFTRCLALAGTVLVGAAAVGGFPRRIGLSVSEAAVSLPGDLPVPTVGTVLGRGACIDASPEIVWRVIEQTFEDEGASRVLACEKSPCLILGVPTPGLEDEGHTGTVVSALLSSTPERALPYL